MTLGRLKWLAIVLPVAFLTFLWVLLHSVFPGLHRFPEVFVLLGITSLGVVAFAFGVFAVVKRLEQQILLQNQELAALLTVGHAASSSLELGELLDGAMDAILEVARADAAEIWLMDAGGAIALARHRGIAKEAFAERARLQVGEGLPGVTARERRPVVVHDLPRDERFVRQRIKRLGFQTYCGLPLEHRGELLGVLGVASKDPETLRSARELRLLEAIGERVATAIANARLHEQVLDGAVVDERMRIARELHDGLAQVLGYINTQTLAVKKLIASGRVVEAAQELDAMETAARQVYGDVREAIVGLRLSLSRQGLVPTLREYVVSFERMTHAELRLEANAEAERLELPRPAEIQLVRIVQEALSNVRKHADASSAAVRLTTDNGTLTVEVVDDGRGFDPEATAPTGWPRLGLQTMRERAESVGGTFTLDAVPGGGTRLRVRVPIEEQEDLGARAAR